MKPLYLGPTTIKRAPHPDNCGGRDYAIIDERGCIIAEVFEVVGDGDWRPAEETALVFAAASDYHAAVEKMIANEQCGGDGWWEGWDELKAAHARATGAKE